MKESWPIISRRAEVQRAYEEMRSRGVSHTLAEMLALRQPPMSNTDREFLEGHCCGNQFEKVPWLGDYYKKIAERAGVNVTGKVYKSSLAAYPGDPRAWVSSRDDVRRICEERGWGCEGAVRVPLRRDVEPPDIAVADDILEDRVQDMIDANPELALRDRNELKEEVKEKIKPHWSK